MFATGRAQVSRPRSCGAGKGKRRPSVTATDAEMHQAPYRVGIDVDPAPAC